MAPASRIGKQDVEAERYEHHDHAKVDLGRVERVARLVLANFADGIEQEGRRNDQSEHSHPEWQTHDGISFLKQLRGAKRTPQPIDTLTSRARINPSPQDCGKQDRAAARPLLAGEAFLVIGWAASSSKFDAGKFRGVIRLDPADKTSALHRF